jgi:hypothetical protein
MQPTCIILSSQKIIITKGGCYNNPFTQSHIIHHKHNTKSIISLDRSFQHKHHP